MRLVLRPARRPDDAEEAPDDALVDWRAALTAECGLHAARDLQRRLRSANGMSARVTAALDRTLDDPARDPLVPAAGECRWIPSPTS